MTEDLDMEYCFNLDTSTIHSNWQRFPTADPIGLPPRNFQAPPWSPIDNDNNFRHYDVTGSAQRTFHTEHRS